jgi:hypothetical protein
VEIIQCQVIINKKYAVLGNLDDVDVKRVWRVLVRISKLKPKRV